MTVRLDLPREAGSVPAVRRLLRSALAVLHVDRESGADLELAITEACANVVNHASGTESFEVLLEVAEDRCAIDVRDDGVGFDPAAVDPQDGEGAAQQSASSRNTAGLTRQVEPDCHAHISPVPGGSPA